MRKLSIILVICGIIFIPPLLARETLVLNTPAGEPLTNAQQTGFLDQVVGEALSRLGYTLRVDKLPAERALLLANSGIADGDLVRIGGLQKQYPNLIQVPEKIFDMEFIAFSKRSDIQINSWDDLKSYTVAIITGWKILENNIPDNVDLTKVKSPQQLFELGSKDRVDIILFSRWQGISFAQANDFKELHPVGSALVTRDMFVYLNRSREGLAADLAKTLREMRQDGSYQRLFQAVIEPLRK